VGSLVLGLSLKRFSGELVKQIKQRPWSNFGIGIVVLFGLPLLSTLALFTVIGAPLGILGWLASLAMYLTAWLLTPLTLGSLVYALATKKAPVVSWRQILLGTVIFTVIGWVPFLGCLFQWFLMLFTLGAMASIKWGALKRWH
jgi:hypothetical protein